MPVDAAVLVDDDGELEAARPAGVSSSGSSSRVTGTIDRLDHEVADLGAARGPRRHGDGVLDVHDAGDVVGLASAQHREPRVAAGRGPARSGRGRCRRRASVHPHPRRHDLVGAAVAERERALQQRRRCPSSSVPCAADRAHERGELLGAARGGELLLRLDAEAAQERVGRAVEHADRDGRRRAVKPRWKPWAARAVSSGGAIARFLGTSSPKTMVSAGRERPARSRARRRATAPAGDADGLQRAVDQVGDRRARRGSRSPGW